MEREKLEQLWRDERNWRRGFAYSCKEDPRVVVPKRNPWGGWTVNFAHPLAIPVILAAVVIAVGPCLLLFASGVRDIRWYWAAIVGSVGILIVVSDSLAGRTQPHQVPAVVLGVLIVVGPVGFLCVNELGSPLRYGLAVAGSVIGLWLLGAIYTRLKG